MGDTLADLGKAVGLLSGALVGTIVAMNKAGVPVPDVTRSVIAEALELVEAALGGPTLARPMLALLMGGADEHTGRPQ